MAAPGGAAISITKNGKGMAEKSYLGCYRLFANVTASHMEPCSPYLLSSCRAMAVQKELLALVLVCMGGMHSSRYNLLFHKTRVG